MAKISILTGIYNCASTLPDAIDSILMQTYTDWELILCDDGSTDDTFQVAKRYRDQHPDKIKLLKNSRNLKLNRTLNRCLEHATGEYIARMDGDDISLPNRLETEISFLEAHPEYAVVSCPMVYFDEGGDWRTGKCSCHTPSPDKLIRGTIHCHAPCMIRSQVIREVGGYSESDRLLRVEDWNLWLKIYAAGYRGYNLDTPLYKMRDDQNAASRRKFKYRLNEAYMTRLVIQTFHMPFLNYIFALRPIIVGMLPAPLYRYLHRKR